MIQVIVRNVWDERRGRLKPEPTVGPDEKPVDEAGATDEAEATDEVAPPDGVRVGGAS
jgi:hypothetical protein